MTRRFVLALALLVGGMVFLQPLESLADKKVHRVAIHVDENDKMRMNMALNNAANVSKYYESKGENVEIEIVAYGPGLHMLRADTSPVKDRIASMSLELDNLSFAACGNTLRNMSKKGDVPLIEEANVVPSGVVRLIQLQEQGWAYVRP